MQNLAETTRRVNLADCRVVAPLSRSDRQRAVDIALLTAESELHELSKNSTPRQTRLIRGALIPAIEQLRRACHRAEILPLLASEGRR